MAEDAGPISEGHLLMHLEPMGLICGGVNTPLTETWIDLTAPSHVLYGLNGAGKTTVLESLEGALLGRAGGGRILARLPNTEADIGVRPADSLSFMLTGSGSFGLDHAHEVFLNAQRESLVPDFERRLPWVGLDVEGSKFDMLDWAGFLADLAASYVWLFTPTGTDRPRWSASPVELVEPSGKWSECLAELRLILCHEDGPIAHELGLDLLWETPPIGAPAGIVGTLVERTTGRDDWNPWWPFGQIVSDRVTDASAQTRNHLISHPTSRWASSPPLERGPELSSRVEDIQRRANLLLAELLAEAPALQLTIGEDEDWFAGRSCSWTATRFEGDHPMPLDRLSSAERRWAHVAIEIALADELNASYDRVFADASDDWTEADRLEGSATTWLLLDEPERGLHRTAETQMARGIGLRSVSGVRPFLATHSPDLLDHGLADVNYVRRRSQDRPGAVISMREFEGVREDLGLNPSDMLRRTRGIALVEGEHDLRILSGMIGKDLLRLGVEMLPLRGGRQLQTATDSRFLFEFTDAVLFPILDDLMLAPVSALWDRHVASARTKLPSEVTDQLRVDIRKLAGKGGEFLEEFLSTSIDSGTFERVQPLGIPQTDILECLPVRALVPEAETWTDLREAARRGNGGVAPSETKFKKYLENVHRADLSPENLGRISEASAVHPDIKALLAAIDARLSV